MTDVDLGQGVTLLGPSDTEKSRLAIPVALLESTSPREHEPPQRMYFQLFMPFRCKSPCSMPFSAGMHDMMVPLATDLCRLALQKSMMTNLGSSLVSFRIASQVDWGRYIPVPLHKSSSTMPGWRPRQCLSWFPRSFSGFESCRVSTNMILRSATALEKIPPSIRIPNASVVAGRKTALDAGGHDHQVRPFLVRIGQWAVRVPCETIGVPSAGCQHEGRSCPRRGYTKVLYNSW